MDYYPQPRPVLYGTRGDDAPPQTQTAPVRTGPPRFPPAPPQAGDAPDPFDRFRGTFASDYIEQPRWGAKLLALLCAIASVYSLLPIIQGAPGFANVVAGEIVLSLEVAISLLISACLVWLGGREYLLALGLALLHVALGVSFSQWQLPTFWVAVAVTLYLLRPSVRKEYWWVARSEIRSDIARYTRRHPRHQAHFRHTLKPAPDSRPDNWRMRW
jgi:hypothetical protein